MSRLGLSAALMAVLLAAGCATVPMSEEAAVEPPRATQTDEAESVSPELVVDAQNVHPGSEIKCRDMLQHASNVIRTRCMSVDAWKRYEQMEAQRAQAILRTWQGSAYSSW
jgi:hypothetical protein